MEDEETQIFQIWILPNEKGLPPFWGTKPFPEGERSGSFVILASGLPEDSEVLPIRADARVVAATLEAGRDTEYRIAAGRRAYLVPASGRIEVNGITVKAGDGLAISDEELLRISALENSEVVMVDVA
ncbi:Quercetin 2,3-dioxygenase [compost metagenome]